MPKQTKPNFTTTLNELATIESKLKIMRRHLDIYDTFEVREAYELLGGAMNRVEEARVWLREASSDA